MLVNWNNRPAPGWGAADDNWAYGSVQRVRMLLDGLATRGTHDLASVTGAMNAAATQDLRSVALTPTLRRCWRRAGAERRGRRGCSALLEPWRAAGSSRLDRDLDGVMDAGPGPAIWDALYPRLFAAAMPVTGLGPLIGTESGPRQRLHRRRLLVPRQGPAAAERRRSSRAPFNERYCGDGDRAACARGVGGARGDPRRSGRAARRRDEGADHVPPRAAADDDPLHEPPERHPAGDLLHGHRPR